MSAFTDYIQAAASVPFAGESWPAEPVPYTSGLLGVVLLSSGRCTVHCLAGAAEGLSAVGGAGSLFVVPVPFEIRPLEPCHCLCACIGGRAAAAFREQIPAPLAQDAGRYPSLYAMLQGLCDTSAPQEERRRSAAAFYILCQLEPDAPQISGWPPLVQRAVAIIRSRYGSLYGVEDLADELGVSKSHLVRAFHAALGETPGRYLTATRIEAAKQLLARGHSLEVVATLCGFSGANYLCKVFKKETGRSPAEYRSTVQPAAGPQLADSAEQNLFL